MLDSKKLLDFGHVVLVDMMGSDQRIVDCARQSYTGGTKRVSEDRGLIRYLVKNRHTTPLESVIATFQIKCPLFIARQIVRHRTASINEESARYSILSSEFYNPLAYRGQSQINKQGSSDSAIYNIPITDPDSLEDSGFAISVNELVGNIQSQAYSTYEMLNEAGVSRELSRNVLPVSIYTQFYWTINLHNLMHFLRLRMDPHAQEEVRVYGQAMYEMLCRPERGLEFTMEAYRDYILEAPSISKFELEILANLIQELKELAICDLDLKTMLNEKIQNNNSLSKREKNESKLIQQLGLN